MTGARFPLRHGAYHAGAVDLLLDRLTSCVAELDALLSVPADGGRAEDLSRGPADGAVDPLAPLTVAGSSGSLTARRSVVAAAPATVAAPLDSRDRAIVTIEAIRAIVAVVREAGPAVGGPRAIGTLDTTGAAWPVSPSTVPPAAIGSSSTVDPPAPAGPPELRPAATRPERTLP